MTAINKLISTTENRIEELEAQRQKRIQDIIMGRLDIPTEEDEPEDYGTEEQPQSYTTTLDKKSPPKSSAFDEMKYKRQGLIDQLNAKPLPEPIESFSLRKKIAKS